MGRKRGPVRLALPSTARLPHPSAGQRAVSGKGSTPLLDRVKLRNQVLQRVIELMSLSRPVKGRGR